MPGDMFPVQAGRSLSIEAMDDSLLLTCRLDRSSLALLSPFQSQILWLVDSVLPVKKLEFLFEKELKFIAQSLPMMISSLVSIVLSFCFMLRFNMVLTGVVVVLSTAMVLVARVMKPKRACILPVLISSLWRSGQTAWQIPP